MGFSISNGNTKLWAISSGLQERRHDEPVHYSMVGVSCIACGITLTPHSSVWTDEDELYDGHAMRCNVLYKATEE